MAFTEIHIDRRHKLFARFYFEVGGTQTMNPFLAAHRPVMAQASQPFFIRNYLDEWQKMDNLGILAEDTQHNKFIPLNAHLVIPDGVGTAPHPLVVMIHGQAWSYFDDDNHDHPITEVKSYRGYRYLQEYLAEKGVASVSVNVNVVNHLGSGAHPGFDDQHRIQIAMLVLAMLFQVGGTPVTTGQPIFFKKTDNTLVPLQDGLALPASSSTTSSEGMLQALKTAITGKLSFTNLGFMGHSRGGTAVQYLQPFFAPRVGTAPTDYAGIVNSTFNSWSVPSGTFNSNTIFSTDTLGTSEHLYHYIRNLVDLIGNPGLAALKVVVSLQPAGKLSLLNTDSTFFLVVASSHDADTEEGSFNSYDHVNCPKAMVFSHGASHGRFNTVWRQLSYVRRAINRQIACQSPIRMLSNAGHENLAKAVIGNAFIGGLRAENHRFLFYTGEQRAPSIGQDIERAWKFPFPLSTPPGILLLDTRAITATNASTLAAVTAVAVAKMSDRQVASHENYANDVRASAFTRPVHQSLAIRIPIDAAADRMVTRTHFSFRYTKEYDARDSSARNAVNLRNYTLRLKAGTNVLGSPIEGSAVPSLVYSAYPTKDYNNVCEEDTVIIMQTAEVPLSQFLNAGQPVTDLNQVTAIEITLNARTGAGTADETWFFVDFLLSTRSLPAAPAGFVIP